MPLQPISILGLRHLPCLLHHAIPGKLALRLRPGLLLRAPTKHRTVSIVLDARDLGRNTQPDPAMSHLDQANRAFGPIRFVRHSIFALANLVDGPRQIAVPFQGVHREIKVCVKNEHKRSNGALG